LSRATAWCQCETLHLAVRRCEPRCECATPGRKPGDGDEEIARLRWVGRIASRLGGAFGRDEARVTVLPSLKLVLEKAAARRRIGEGRKVPIEAGEKASGTALLHITGHAAQLHHVANRVKLIL